MTAPNEADNKTITGFQRISEIKSSNHSTDEPITAKDDNLSQYTDNYTNLNNQNNNDRLLNSSINEHVHNMANHLHAKNYHPVILFGVNASGKSSLLASLISYLQTDTNANVSIRLGDSIIPPDTTVGKYHYDEGVDLFLRRKMPMIPIG